VRQSSHVKPQLRTHLVMVLALLCALALGPPASASIEITLKNSFIEEYKNRATVEAHFVVDKAHEKPNAPSKDGDLHVAGRADEVQLPIVAEIMNAKFEKDAQALIHGAEGTGTPIRVTGAWRLWTEHGGDSTQTQGKPLDPFTTTNPDHVFEIHPVTRVGDEGVEDSFKPIRGYKYKDAFDAFQRYENVRSEIGCGTTSSTITTGMAGYNYVDFVMELAEDPTHEVADGLTVFASVLDRDGDLLVRNRRMVFAKGTPPEQKVRTMKAGNRLRVLGIPRISLTLVSWRCENAASRPEVLHWNLPYEIIVVAVLGK